MRTSHAIAALQWMLIIGTIAVAVLAVVAILVFGDFCKVPGGCT